MDQGDEKANVKIAIVPSQIDRKSLMMEFYDFAVSLSEVFLSLWYPMKVVI